jgi:hypothetical protein
VQLYESRFSIQKLQAILEFLISERMFNPLGKVVECRGNIGWAYEVDQEFTAVAFLDSNGAIDRRVIATCELQVICLPDDQLLVRGS